MDRAGGYGMFFKEGGVCRFVNGGYYTFHQLCTIMELSIIRKILYYID